jgi:hypothetical protein
MVASEREAGDSLVLASGMPWAWISEQEGFAVRKLPTRHGSLDFKIKGDSSGSIHVEIGGNLRVPDGGFIIRPPGEEPIRSVEVNGVGVSTFTDREVVVKVIPALVTIRSGA